MHGYKRKNKKLGSKTYLVLGSTIDYAGRSVVRKSYTTRVGKVVIENGIVTHPDGTKERE